MDTTEDTTSDQLPWELTRNPVDGTWGFICREHGLHRSGLNERHAQNVEAKHVRDEHADPLAAATIDLRTAARFLTQAQTTIHSDARTLWVVLTGLPYDQAMALATHLATQPAPVLAHAAPF